MPLLNEDSAAAEPLPAAWASPVTLKHHQRTALHRCMALETRSVDLREEAPELRHHAVFSHGRVRSRVGVFGDRVGSGKSYVLLALVMATRGRSLNAEGCEPYVKSFGGGCITLTQESHAEPSDVSVLVIPHNLRAQWEGYAKAFSPDLRWVCVCRSTHVAKLAAVLSSPPTLIIVINTFFKDVAALLNRQGRPVKRVIFDEADSLSLPSAATVDASFHWFVTASYPNLVVPPYRRRPGGQLSGAVRALFDDICSSGGRDVMPALLVRNDDAFVALSMRFPEPVVERVMCLTPRAIRVLDGVADRGIIDCLSAGDLPGALLHVRPGNVGSEANIVALLVDKLQRQLGNLQARIALVPELQYESDVERDADLSRLEARRDHAAGTIQSIRERIATVDDCCICYNEITDKTVVPCCSNAFCLKCISKWTVQSGSCPLCKATLRVPDLLVVSSGVAAAAAAAAPVVQQLDKLQNLERIVKRVVDAPDAAGAVASTTSMGRGRGRGKMLIFSMHDHSFVEITAMLDRAGVRYSFLRGNHHVVKNTVDRYKTGDLDALLVNPLHYGSGLNFENTTDIIMYHQVEPEVQKQVIGRALRMGRTAPLTVWHLLYENEAEG